MRRLLLASLGLVLAAGSARGHDGPNAHNKADELIAKYTAELQDAPDDPLLLRERGYLYLLVQEEYEAGLADFEKLLACKTIGPKTREAATVCRAIGRHRTGDWKGALEDLDGVCGAGSTNAAAWFARGELRHQLGLEAGALDDLNRALFLRRWPLCLVRLAEVKVATGDVKGAIADYGAALTLDPRHVEALAGRALAHARNADPQAAAADLGEAATCAAAPSARPEDRARTHAARARHFLARGFDKDARSEAAVAVDLYRKEVAAARSPHKRAQLFLEIGRLASEVQGPGPALEVVREALAATPERPDLLRLEVLLLGSAPGAKPEVLAEARRRLAAAEARWVPRVDLPRGTPARPDVAPVASPVPGGR